MHMDLALYFLEDLLQSISYISDTQWMLVHLVMDAIRHHQSPIVPHAQTKLVKVDTPMHSSQHFAPSS